MQIRIAAGGKGAEQIERRRRLAIGLHQPVGVGHAPFGVEFDAVDVVAAIGGKGHAALGLGVLRAGLGELAGDAADFDHGHGAGEGQDHRHLQQHAEGVADIVGMELGEALGAIPALKQESLIPPPPGPAPPSNCGLLRRKPEADRS